MGKGDKKTKKGKFRKKSFGNSRRKTKKTTFIKLEDLRKWSIEWLFAYIGRYDFTVSIKLKNNSNSSNKYSANITGILYYTKKERKILNSTINSGIRIETNGKVKIKISLKDDLNNDKLKELIKEGFDNEDIAELFYHPYKNNKTYFNKRRKELPSPIEINIKPKHPPVVYLKMIYNLYKRRISEGEQLLNHEKMDMAAIQKALNIEENDENFVFTELMEQLKVNFDFLVEEYLFRINKIESFSNEVLKNKYDAIKRIVDIEFLKGGININDPKEIVRYSGLYLGAIQMGLPYKNKIILYSTTPKIILDYKGFFHVAFRHCPLFDIGQKNQYKSKIPYSLLDIEPLIANCLDSIKNDIKEHFKNHPDKRFSKFGDELIRFNGNYFEIHINTEGIIETFYNH